MGRKLPIRNFEEFEGVDITSSPLSISKKAASELININKLYNGSLTGRKGLRLAAQPLHVTKIFKYTYLDETGEPMEELLGVGFPVPYRRGYLYKLATSAVEINYTGSDVWSYSIFTDTTLNKKFFRIVEDGTQILNFDMGSGYEESFVTLYDLKVAIDALTDFTLTIYQAGVVDGDQLVDNNANCNMVWANFFGDSSFTHIVELDGGGEFDVLGLMVSAFDTPTQTWVKFYADRGLPYYTSVAANRISFTDGQLLGHARLPAVLLKSDLSYTYWQPIVELFNLLEGFLNGTDLIGEDIPLGHYHSPFYLLSQAIGCSRRTGISATNKKNCIYITGNNISERAEKDRALGQSTFHNSGAYKYDSSRLRMAGVISTIEKVELTLSSSGTTAPLPAGTYYYKLSFLTNDAQGNTFERFSESFRSIAANGTNDVNMLIYDLTAGGRRQYGYISRTSTATVTNDTWIPVGLGHGFKVNDYVYINTGLNSVRCKVIAINFAEIRIDRNISSLASGTTVSNVLIRVWRSKVNGSKVDSSLFRAWELPALIHNSGPTTIVDNRADTNLAEVLTSVKPEYSQYSLPKGHSIVDYQGNLVIGGGERAKNTIFWEDANSPEFTSLAFNNTEVPVLEESVSALQEDPARALIAYTPTGQYSISGNLQTGEIEISKTVSNGYGALFSNAVKTVHEFIVGVGKLGLWRTNYSQILEDLGRPIRKLFRPFNSNDWVTYVQFSKVDNTIHVFVGTNAATASVKDNGEPTAAINSYRHFVYSVDSKCWSEYVYNSLNQCANGGIEVYNNKRYQQSFVYQSSWASATHSTGGEYNRWTGYLHEEVDEYVDHVYPYDWSYVSAWDDLGAPEYDEACLDFILYSVQSEYYQGAYDVDFESYRNWDFTKVDSQRTMTFSAATQTEAKIQFDKNYKARRRAFKLSGSVNGNPPVISGYSMTVADTQYKKGRVVP
jgi:hypothetical protein